MPPSWVGAVPDLIKAQRHRAFRAFRALVYRLLGIIIQFHVIPPSWKAKKTMRDESAPPYLQSADPLSEGTRPFPENPWTPPLDRDFLTPRTAHPATNMAAGIGTRNVHHGTSASFSETDAVSDDDSSSDPDTPREGPSGSFPRGCEAGTAARIRSVYESPYGSATIPARAVGNGKRTTQKTAAHADLFVTPVARTSIGVILDATKPLFPSL
jgi:hypothetical protein